MKNKGFRHERLEHNPREKAFAEHWEYENTDRHCVDFGNGILQGLFIQPDERMRPYFSRPIIKITKRERWIVATIIQWLGSNIGMEFLETSLKNCGYKISRIGKE